MVYAILVDWQKEWDSWENVGRRVAEEFCDHKDVEGQSEPNIIEYEYCDICGHGEDSTEPMMNYAYPLETVPSDEKVKEVIDRTNLTVMYNIDEDKFYLALTGGGMDLSQDIALAYNICETWIPIELCLSVNSQKGLSQGGKHFDEMAKAVIESLKKNIIQANFKIKELNKETKGDKHGKKR